MGLAGYWIDGIPYCASGLTVDPTATPEAHLTDEGFSCIAFFPPELLVEGTVRKNGIITMRFGGPPVAVVRVQVDVRAHGIFCMAEFIQGRQHNLFFEPDAVARLSAFCHETGSWFAVKN
jgi:hypothetical protein